MITIEAIADYRYGTSILPKDYDDTGEVSVINAKMVTVTGIIKPEKRVLMGKRLRRHILKNGDVLLQGRTNNNFNAAVFTNNGEPSPLLAVCTAAVIILRIKNTRIKPAFLAWALNQRPTQTALKNAQQGSTIQLISTKALGQIHIPAATHETQTKALQLNELTAHYQKIVNRHCESIKKLTLEKLWKT